MAERTRRSLLYAPAVLPERIETAAESAADAVIVDLESTVDVSRKENARRNLGSVLERINFAEKEVVVRINGLRSDHWLADLEAATDAGVDTIRLPKIEAPWEVRTAVESTNQITDAEPEFLIQLESPRGLLNGNEIASACGELPQVTGIGIGIGDYTKSLGLGGHTADLQSYLLNTTAAYAAVGNMDPLGYVHKDLESLRSAAERAKTLGHVGQPVSHAVQTEKFIDILNDVYS